ncbi:FlgB family protein [Alloyangia pacifica]|uniref:FlgB family protein n=1 Tax=Alloyangia pacifica TaxID=311180 RepID=UPI001CD7FC81|nr:FlgB family protein [Alloyangia pacifica]MCA0995422.1 FlgB family protein [Alloyangia pacifica]
MFQNLDVFRTAIAMARHAGARQAASAQNIANADTPGYRGVDPPDFVESLGHAPTAMRATRSTHLSGVNFGHRDTAEAGLFGAGEEIALSQRQGTEDPNGNTVSLETEMLTAVDAQRAHDRALAIYRSNLTLLRASLGT